MCRSLEIKLKCIPPKSTHQSGLRILKNKQGRTFIGRFNSGKSKQETQFLTELLFEYIPDKPFEGPLKVFIGWMYPHLKSTPKKNLDKIIPCDKRPDIDNLTKNLFDTLTRLGFFIDDSQVFDLHFVKMYNPVFGIYIKIEEIN